METLLAIDLWAFFLLNHLPHNQIFDLVGLVLSGVGTAGIIWFLLGIWLFIREERKHHWFFAPLLLSGVGSWIFAEKILKNVTARPRPSAEIGAVILGVSVNDYSFPSGHATIAFAMAVVLSKIEPRWKWLFYLLAVAISFSRIYLGKHFPLDVIAGAILGWIIGHVSLWASDFAKKKFVKVKNHKKTPA